MGIADIICGGQPEQKAEIEQRSGSSADGVAPLKELEFLVFNEEQAEDLIVNLGLSVSRGGFVTRHGVAVRCECCGRMIRVRNVGNIVPGSTKVYCDNPACFAEYVDRYLWE